GKTFRWEAEHVLGEKIGAVRASRNQVLNGSISVYVNRTAGRTDVLHEYFVAPEQLGAFLARVREVVPRHGLDLLNVTLRSVSADPDTVLRYADRDLIAVVMFFEQPTGDPAAEDRMRALTRELIDAALALGGRYYLPYRRHASREQFARAYPRAAAFFAAKRRFDPEEIFRSRFYAEYGRP